MSPADASAVAVINADASAFAIWHVAVEPVAQIARLCGAWVTDDPEVQRKVVAARLAVVVGDRPTKAVTTLLTLTHGRIDLPATLTAITDHTNSLDALHADSRTAKGNQRAPITWPTIPKAPDWAALPPVPTGVVDDPMIISTVATARWLADLADVWSAIETLRTSRPHLSRGEPEPIPVPFALA